MANHSSVCVSIYYYSAYCLPGNFKSSHITTKRIRLNLPYLCRGLQLFPPKEFKLVSLLTKWPFRH